MKKSLISPILVFILFFSFTAMVSACSYNDHSDCKVTETIVEGKIYFADTNQSAGNADVTITCSHNGTDYVKTTKSLNNGFLKGTYFVLFPQSQCISGDEVVVSAVKGDKSGSEDGDVKDWITRRCLDVDLALVNVPLVPEFGVIVGALTALGAVGVFFIIRKK